VTSGYRFKTSGVNSIVPGSVGRLLDLRADLVLTSML
jgi:hypothetical protein